MATMPQIETVVMLMLENRSLDTMLGWLYEDGVPHYVFPPKSSPRFNGIRKDDFNMRGTVRIRPAHGSRYPGQGSRMPRWGPKEDMYHVQRQMYADGNGNMADKFWGPPPMTGFAFDFPESERYRYAEVMGAYTKAELPVLYGLAENFAVSDRWFSSVPTETDANRAFSICGTSHGIEDDISLPYFHEPTIFNGLWDEAYGQQNKTWGIYWQYKGILDLDPTPIERVCFTVDKFTKLHEAVVDRKQGVVDKYENFLTALRTHQDIPQFCYLEPFWGWGVGDADGQDFWGLQGNDYHPPAWVGAAEHDLNELYEALKKSRQWKNMLFIISFDEAGGTWDHERPTKVLNPDGIVGKSGFAFDRLGVRVPTILVSPWIFPGTVFRAPTANPQYDFDHTSVIKTILEWAGTDRQFIDSMGLRVANAPMFDGALSTTSYLENAPKFTVPPQYAEQSTWKGIHPSDFPLDLSRFSVAEFKAAARNTSSREELFAELERRAGS